MPYLHLLLAMTFSATITVGGRLYNNKNQGRANVSRLYNLMVPISGAIGWLVLYLTDLSFDARVLLYSLLYGVFYTAFTVGMLGALKVGSTSLTALIKQIALVGVSVWGFAFWEAPFTAAGAVGIVLIVISLCLCLLTKEKPDGEEKPHSTLKWLPFAALITVGNAGCAIVQRYQQMAFDYQHKNMFMFFGVLFAAVVCFFMALPEEKTNWKAAVKTSWTFPAISGLSSAFSNVFILLLVNSDMSPAIIYPGIAVGGLMITTLISLVVFRERLRPLQWCGMTVGAIALVLLNL